MHYLLHHATGTLVLDAKDKSSVLSWIDRQLGKAACRATVVEIGEAAAPKRVEKSGTGVSPECEAFIRVTADSIQRVARAGNTKFDCLARILAHSLDIKKSLTH